MNESVNNLVSNLLNNESKKIYNTYFSSIEIKNINSSIPSIFFIFVYKENINSKKYIFEISSKDYILYTCHIHCQKDGRINVNNITKFSYGSFIAPEVVIDAKTSYIN